MFDVTSEPTAVDRFNLMPALLEGRRKFRTHLRTLRSTKHCGRIGRSRALTWPEGLLDVAGDKQPLIVRQSDGTPDANRAEHQERFSTMPGSTCRSFMVISLLASGLSCC
jgi:hypothetical protein